MFSSGIDSVRGICCFCDSDCCTDSLPSVAWALGMFSSGIEGFLGSDLVSSAAAGGRVVADSAFAMLLCAALRLCVEAGVSFTTLCFSSSIAAERSVGILYSSASPPSSRAWLSCYTDSNFIELCFFFSETSVSCCCYFSSSTIAGTCS